MIGLLASSYPGRTGDHRGHFVRRFALELERRGWPVTVVAPRTSAGARALSAGDPELVEVGPGAGLFGGSGVPANLWRRPWALWELGPVWVGARRWLIEHGPGLDAVVAHWLLPFGLLAALTREEHGRPVWIVAHSGGVHVLGGLPSAARREVGAALARGADQLTFVTSHLRARFLALVGERAARALAGRCGVLPMGVDTERFAGSRPAAEGPIATVGRLTPLKGVDRLLRAAARLPSRPRVRLVGDGPERGRLERLAGRLGVRVEWAGEQPAEAVARLLDGAALLTVPSRRGVLGYTEGLPVALLEGLAAGLPALTTESWPIPSEIRAMDGVRVVSDDVDGLARGLAACLEAGPGGPAEVAARRAAVAATFDWGVVGERAAAEMRALLGERIG